ncbi:MAG: Lrp/AsnC family transcriptional regulator [Deltaproteobacteria bacterium]|jgi:Lrp/AsnC family transcriptional regulator, leucine-responsive regulatory protein|nr:Lrp/AsnC family transcriptional regulator [Deltaproteobacteria bacterium]
MKTGHQLDKIDYKILTILQKGGRTKRSHIAEATGLSIPSISDRLKRLEGDGVISKYSAIVNPYKLGFDVTAFIIVTVDSSEHYDAFLDTVTNTNEIIECHAITGEGTHMLKVRVKNTKSLEELLSTIQSWGGVSKTMTRVVLSSHKETMTLPVE